MSTTRLPLTLTITSPTPFSKSSASNALKVRRTLLPDGLVMAFVAVVWSVNPPLSVTVRVTVKGPVDEYACVAVTPVPVVPSPKVHAYVVIEPSGSELPDASKLIAVPIGAVVADSVNFAVGGTSAGGLTVMSNVF